MKLCGNYDSPSPFSRAVMAFGDMVSFLLVPRRPSPRIPLAPERVQNLLLLRLDGIGDNICSWPALELLRRHLPNTEITLAVGPWATPLYRECPWIDELIEWDSGLFGLFRGKGLSNMAVDLQLTKELRKRGFDAGIDMRGDLLSILLLHRIGTPTRTAETSRGGSRLLSDPVRLRSTAEVQRTFEIACTAVGLSAEPAPRVRDWLRPQARALAARRLSEIGWDSAKPSAALCPMALWPWKQWPKEHFRELALRLKKELGFQIIWFLERKEQVTDLASEDPVFCGPLDEVAAALGMCRIAVCSDSGLLHLAVAAGCHTVQLFGPGNAERFAHTGENLAVHHDRTCTRYPCVQKGTCANLASGWCMDKISVTDVFNSCSEFMP